MDAPQNPAGPYEAPETPLDAARREALIAEVAGSPAALRRAVAGLSAPGLDARYRNWTARQIVHHLADSHMHAYLRFKLALTESTPVIKPYDETRTADLEDTRTADIGVALALIEALHTRWAALLRTMDDQAFGRRYFHPESGRVVRLDEALAQYAWHGRHHTAQIAWIAGRDTDRA